MGKKMKLPFLSDSSTGSPSWPWPAYCQQPRTLSFRTSEHMNMFKTINSSYSDANTIDVVDTPESWFTNSSESASFSTVSDASGGGDCIETMIRGLRSERLFFEPGETSSILEEAKAGAEFPFKESVVLSLESQDPYVDFKKSMEEMVEAYGLKDWEGLEELLCCYLRVNGKSNHGYIVGAFVDLLVGLAFASSAATTTTCDDSSCSCSHDSPTSPLSFYTSTCSDDSSSTPCVSSLQAEEEEIDISHCLSSLEEVENEIEEN